MTKEAFPPRKTFIVTYGSFNKLYCTSVYSLVQNVCHILKNIIILLEVRIMINCLKMYLVATTMLLFP